MKSSCWVIGPCLTLMHFFSLGARAGTITVSTSEPLRSSKGTLRCALWTQALGFPVKPENAMRLTMASVSGNTAVCTFKDVQAGQYAMSILHDENDNEKMDFQPAGAPMEGYGTSNNAEPLPTSPPTFEAARFDYDGSPLELAIAVRYTLPEEAPEPPTP